MNITVIKHDTLTLVAIVLFVLSSSPAGGIAQDIISAPMLHREQNAFGFSGLPFLASESFPWRFSAGDDIRWADTQFPDNTWQRASPTTITDNALRSPEFAHAKIGWFRLHFRVDSTLNNRSFGFVMALVGAAEVYVDGRLVAQYGVPSSTSESEEIASVSRFTLQAVLLHLSSNEPHVLAVRYSFAHYDDYISRPYQGGLISLPTGLRTAFMTWKAVESYRATAFQTVIQFGVAIGMPLLAGILHLVLFLLYRQERANILVSIFSFVTALQAASFALSSHVMGQSLSAYALGGIGQTIALPCIGVSLWYVAHTLFGMRLPRYHWWILGTNVIVWLLVFFVGDTPSALQSIVELLALCVAFIPLILILPVLVSAMRKNLDGAYILGIGMGICVLAWTLEIIMLSMGLLYAARPLLIAIFIRSGVYIAIPLSLSVLLARRTARLAQRLAEQNEHLEENVQKRTEALSQANMLLQEQNRQLEEVNQEKNEIIGIVSHDLKNPIGAIRGMAELLQIGFIEQEQTPMFATQIVEVSDRMLGLVKNLLEVNRLESGGMQPHISEVNILPIVQASIAQYRPQAELKNISIMLESALQDSRVAADEQAFVQVMDNLLSNAVKYSPHGKNVYVRIKSHSFDSNGTTPPMTSDHYLRVEVQDEGPGISSEDMKKLFGKFARLSARPTGGEHSTGLGLSIVKKMVEAMQGRVWCESELGDGLPTGARFIVELPRV